MSWMELSLNTTAEAVDWVSTLLATAHYSGEMQVTPYVSPLQQGLEAQNWTYSVCLYFPNKDNVNQQLQELDSLLSSLHRTGQSSRLQMAIIEQKPAAGSLIHRIGQRFVVLAPGTPHLAQAKDIVLQLNPSLSFGSGLHPTTIVSLKLLERHIAAPMQGLDLGCGSGILSIAMAQLGASVLAIDNDSVAIESTQDAVHQNKLEQQITVMEASLGSGSQLGHWLGGLANNTPTVQPAAKFDFIVANVLARVHIALAQDYRRSLRANSPQLLLTAGYTADYELEVTSALAAVGFAAVDSEQLEEWVAIAYHLQD